MPVQFSRFFDLPPEIRGMIYDQYFEPDAIAGSKIILVSWRFLGLLVMHNIPLSLARVSKRMRVEALPHAAKGATLDVKLFIDHELDYLRRKLSSWMWQRAAVIILRFQYVRSGFVDLSMFSLATRVEFHVGANVPRNRISLAIERWDDFNFIVDLRRNMQRQLSNFLGRLLRGHRDRGGPWDTGPYSMRSFRVAQSRSPPLQMFTTYHPVVVTVGRRVLLNSTLQITFVLDGPSPRLRWVPVRSHLEYVGEGRARQEERRRAYVALSHAIADCGVPTPENFGSFAWFRQN